MKPSIINSNKRFLLIAFFIVFLSAFCNAQQLVIKNIHDAYNQLRNDKKRIFDKSVEITISKNALSEDLTIEKRTFNNQFKFKSESQSLLKELIFTQDNFNKQASFVGKRFAFLMFNGCYFNDSLKFYMDNDIRMDSLYIENTTFNKGLDLSGTTINNILDMSGTMKGTLDLSYVTVGGPNTQIDLSDLRPFKDKYGHIEKIVINLTRAPIANIELNYNDFELESSSLEDIDTATSIYTALLANYKTRGMMEQYKNVYIDYQHYINTHGSLEHRIYGTIRDGLQYAWWNYGYDKERIIWITLFSLLIITLINIFCYKKLNTEVYKVDENNFQDKPNNFYNSLVYTSIVFFSFTLSLEKLQFGKKRYLLWFIFTYLLGIVCIAYLANYVLKAGEGALSN